MVAMSVPATWLADGGGTVASVPLLSTPPDGDGSGMVVSNSARSTTIYMTGDPSTRSKRVRWIWGAVAIATLPRSSGSIAPRRFCSNHSVWLPVAGGELSGDKLIAGLNARTTGDGDRLPAILDISEKKNETR